MTTNCNPITCPAYASGWCEYDAIAGELYPMDPEQCLILKEENENAGTESE